MPALAGLTDAAGPWLLAACAVFLRVGAAMALLPAFGERTVPVRIRLMLALGFTLIVMPGIVPMLPPIDSGMLIGRWLLSETVIGLAIGAVLRLFVLGLQIAGSIAAQSVSLAQIFGGQALEPQPAIGHVLVIAGLALAVMAGLHVKIAMFLTLSYDLMPPGRLPDAADLMEWGLQRTSHAFALGFTLAAPFVVTSLLYNLALGVINRAMPQLMVAFVGAPAITAGGLVLLALAAPLMLRVWLSAMDVFLAAPREIVP
ncbi:flagellar biosynthetic protein FliR [Oceaniovalibus guishaninsula]|uniref:flagellar biosynthetic protein FliR n=1 Tax=Oceaniovalibus guishaninsula TaxID=1046117 RepID=UPI001EE65120|nr:flagellar biosynthetic protein FliR [Oceaniovalibus guishaninsula]